MTNQIGIGDFMHKYESPYNASNFFDKESALNTETFECENITCKIKDEVQVEESEIKYADVKNWSPKHGFKSELVDPLNNFKTDVRWSIKKENVENTTDFNEFDDVKVKSEPVDNFDDKCRIDRGIDGIKSSPQHCENYDKDYLNSLYNTSKTDFYNGQPKSSDIVLSENSETSCSLISPETKENINKQKQINAEYERLKHMKEKGTFGCKFCDYTARYKYNYLEHINVHADIEQAILYKCQFCSFASRWKKSLDKHVIIKHIKVDNVEKCTVCPFTCKDKGYLSKHMKKHMNPNELFRYKCNLCPYITIHKNDMTRHEITHKPDDEVEIFQCNNCSFKSRFKKSLYCHMKRHLKPEHKCNYCDYKTVHKCYLKNHEKIHMSDHETELFHCLNCSYKSKLKARLARHVKTHMRIEARDDRYKCNNCEYQTFCSKSLKKHNLKHLTKN